MNINFFLHHVQMLEEADISFSANRRRTIRGLTLPLSVLWQAE